MTNRAERVNAFLWIFLKKEMFYANFNLIVFILLVRDDGLLLK